MSHADQDGAVAPFTPVAVAPRADGWTPGKQAAFIEALAETSCVATAAARVGMSRESAYRLRARPDAETFRTAWEAALRYSLHRLSEAAFDRALNGVPVPIFYKGEQVGERRHFDERLTQFLLRTRDPVRHGLPMERARIHLGYTLEGLAKWLGDTVTALHAGGSSGRPRRRISRGT